MSGLCVPRVHSAGGVSRQAHETVDLRIAQDLKDDSDMAVLATQIKQAQKNLDEARRQINSVARKGRDPATVAAERHLRKLTELYDDLRNAKREELIAQRSKDNAKDDDAKDEKTRDAVERFQERLTDLIGKLGKELGPVAEEVRKALERAVGEVHNSLEKEGLSAEELGKALEKSQDELRKAFESGGPVNEELREAIERSRNEVQDAVEQARDLIKDQVDALRQNSDELAQKAKDNLAPRSARQSVALSVARTARTEMSWIVRGERSANWSSNCTVRRVEWKS